MLPMQLTKFLRNCLNPDWFGKEAIGLDGRPARKTWRKE